MRAFIFDCKEEPVNLRQIGIVGMSLDVILDTMCSVYEITT